MAREKLTKKKIVEILKQSSQRLDQGRVKTRYGKESKFQFSEALYKDSVQYRRD